MAEWEGSLAGWEDSLVGWEGSLVGWEDSLVGWEGSLAEREGSFAERVHTFIVSIVAVIQLSALGLRCHNIKARLSKKKKLTPSNSGRITVSHFF